MDTAKVIVKLNEILRHEWTGVAQYAQASFIVSGFWREIYSGTFMASSKESFVHAEKIADKIVALGGVPTVERNPIKQSQDLKETLQHALEFEVTAVNHYVEALEICGDDRALVVLLEDILLEEQDGVDDIKKLLGDFNVASGGDSVSQAG